VYHPHKHRWRSVKDHHVRDHDCLKSQRTLSPHYTTLHCGLPDTVNISIRYLSLDSWLVQRWWFTRCRGRVTSSDGVLDCLVQEVESRLDCLLNEGLHWFCISHG
jgi:hypothetical protein